MENVQESCGEGANLQWQPASESCSVHPILQLGMMAHNSKASKTLVEAGLVDILAISFDCSDFLRLLVLAESTCHECSKQENWCKPQVHLRKQDVFLSRRILIEKQKLQFF